ncbi:hypothetical protein AQJ67_18580 [Streptomyces caeruleatus]|uniref:Uncharacterized protein n=1 Tax=Streptomyces caeruleatus TaxID=661399 RepID=A0A117RQ19_9ACTN|nr:hypothetical protein AQJ67_18580 [Streptomyces caeruleatus]
MRGIADGHDEPTPSTVDEPDVIETCARFSAAPDTRRARLSQDMKNHGEHVPHRRTPAPITSQAVDSPATLRRTGQAASEGCPDPAPDAGRTHTCPEGSEPARPPGAPKTWRTPTAAIRSSRYPLTVDRGS